MICTPQLSSHLMGCSATGASAKPQPALAHARRCWAFLVLVCLALLVGIGLARRSAAQQVPASNSVRPLNETAASSPTVNRSLPDELRVAEVHRRELDLAMNVTFWLTLGVLGILLLSWMRSRGSLPQLRVELDEIHRVLCSNIVLVALALANVLTAAYAIYMCYEAPRDAMQDIASAEQLLHGETPYRSRFDFSALLEGEPARMSMGKCLPRLKALEDEQLEWIEATAPSWIEAHPPLTILSIVPFVVFLGIHGTLVALSVVSLASLPLTLILLRRGLALPLSRREATALSLVVLGWYPVVGVLRNDQPGILLGALIVAGWFWLRRGRPRPAGVAVGVATCLKLYPGLLFVYLLLRHRQAFWAAVLTTSLLLCLSVPLTGVQAYVDYVRTAGEVVARNSDSIGNLSLRGLLAPFPMVNWVFPCLALLAIGFMAYLVRAPAGSAENNSRSPAVAGVSNLSNSSHISLRPVQPPDRGPASLDLEYSLFVVAMLLLCPIVWPHYLTILLLPLAVLGQQVLGAAPKWRHVLWLLALLAVLSAPDETFVAAFFFVKSLLSARLYWVLKSLPNLAMAALWVWIATLTKATRAATNAPAGFFEPASERRSA